jgi:hypothetical protein
MTYHDVSEALAQSGCCICRLADDAVRRYLGSLLWESVNDPGVREKLRGARGFCREHSWQVQSMGSPMSVAILWRDLLTQEVTELRRPGAELRRRRPAPQRKCPACAQRDEAEQRFLETLLEHLEVGGLRGEYTDSWGLCLPHIEGALRSAPRQAYGFLVEAESEKLNRLLGELSEIIRKNDYRFRDEPWGAERDAWVRATGKLKGEKPGT